MDAKEAKKRAIDIAQELEGIAGQLPIERIVRKHRGFFDELRGMGATWGQVAKLMTEAGVRRADGASLTERHWSAMYSRGKRRKAQTEKADANSAPLKKENLSNQSRHLSAKPQNPTNDKTHLRSMMARAKRHRT